MKVNLSDLSFKLIILSTIMIVLGLSLGSFIQYTVLLASFGGFLLLVGIVIYIVSQLMISKTDSVLQEKTESDRG